MKEVLQKKSRENYEGSATLLLKWNVQFIHLDLPRGAEWIPMIRGAYTPSFRSQTAPFGRCWYVYQISLLFNGSILVCTIIFRWDMQKANANGMLWPGSGFNNMLSWILTSMLPVSYLGKVSKRLSSWSSWLAFFLQLLTIAFLEWSWKPMQNQPKITKNRGKHTNQPGKKNTLQQSQQFFLHNKSRYNPLRNIWETSVTWNAKKSVRSFLPWQAW